MILQSVVKQLFMDQKKSAHLSCLYTELVFALIFSRSRTIVMEKFKA